MEIEKISPLMHARHVAEGSHLSGVLDAFETVCAYGYYSESWQGLATQLTLYLDAEGSTKSTPRPTLTFRSEISLEVYLVLLDDAELAYLACDAVTALLHATAVFAPSQHLEFDFKTSCINLVTWDNAQVSQRQIFVRRYLFTLSNDDLHLLLTGINGEIVARSYLEGVRQFSPTKGQWTQTDVWIPCSNSHLEILPRLKLKMSGPDANYLKHAVHYSPPISAATLLQRATHRASLFLGSPRRDQSKDIHSSSLMPIMEDRPASMFTRSGLDADGRSKRDTKRSSFSDYRSFVTAWTHRTGSSAPRSFATGESRRSFGTAEKRSTMQTFMSWPTEGPHTDAMANLSQWSETLKQRDIVPDPELENWSSGRGQHAEYESHERNVIPLTVESVLGKTNTAVVESVRCMRVQLVRKVVRCNKRTRLKREDALQEVQQLYRAQHSHVVRLVGTYIIDDELAILTYPCAEWNLEQFLAITPTALVLAERTQAITKFFTCLAKTLDFVHSFPIKHMDIKPQNILVRNIRHTSINDADPFKIYLTDFGSSRFYPSIEDTETDSLTPFTRAYAAQEVILQERRGLSADVFSMGCVYAEMLAIVLDGLTNQQSTPDETPTHWYGLKQARSGTDGKPRPYFSKITEVLGWLHGVPIAQSELDNVRKWIIKMLNSDQTLRPSAREIAEDPNLPLACRSCMLRSGPEQFEASSPPENQSATSPQLRDSIILHRDRMGGEFI